MGALASLNRKSKHCSCDQTVESIVQLLTETPRLAPSVLQVYLHEIASKRRQGFTGSIGFASAISGCMLGVLVVMVLEVLLNPQQVRDFSLKTKY